MKMPQPKLFKHFVKKSKVVESLSQPSPLLPAATNPLVKQQASAKGTRTPIPSTPGRFPKATQATPTLEQEDGITHNHTFTFGDKKETNSKGSTDTKDISSIARPTI